MRYCSVVICKDIAGYLSKVADFDTPYLHLAPPVEFRGDLWHQKTTGVWCGVVCVILHFAVLVEHCLVTDGHRHRQRHRPMSSSADA